MTGEQTINVLATVVAVETVAIVCLAGLVVSLAVERLDPIAVAANLGRGWRLLISEVFRRSAPARLVAPVSLDTAANTGRASRAQDQQNRGARP